MPHRWCVGPTSVACPSARSACTSACVQTRFWGKVDMLTRTAALSKHPGVCPGFASASVNPHLRIARAGDCAERGLFWEDGHADSQSDSEQALRAHALCRPASMTSYLRVARAGGCAGEGALHAGCRAAADGAGSLPGDVRDGQPAHHPGRRSVESL